MTLHDTLNDDERLAGLDLRQLEQLVGLVEYDESADPFPVSGWEHVRAVLAAAHFRGVRIHQALTWASITVACFFVWTVAVLAIA